LLSGFSLYALKEKHAASVGVVRVNKCHWQNMNFNITNGLEESKSSVVIYIAKQDNSENKYNN